MARHLLTWKPRRQRPDLRRDCDFISHCLFHFLPPCVDDKDLIYEGIATIFFALFPLVHLETTKTWFTKGLRPFSFPPFLIWLPFFDDKDLIYEGIATMPWFSFIVISLFLDDKDLIYEGIATWILSWCPNLLLCEKGRQRPDLRRDCDGQFALMVISDFLDETTKTWFTKGLRR